MGRRGRPLTTMLPAMTDTISRPADATTCPACHRQLAALRGARWCPECEWNLGRYDPDRHGRLTGWGWLDRSAYRTAYRLNARQFAALAGSDPATARARLARTSVIAISAGLLILVLAMFTGGIVLIVLDFPSLTIVPGVVLVLISIILRPRFGRIDPLPDRLTPDQAPALFRLIEQVAAAAAAPTPHIVLADRELNASASAVGLRRRRVLTLGLPLWAILPPQARVALLAHELGHFGNGDIRRMPLTQLAFTTVGTAAVLTRPDPADIDRAVGFGVIIAYLSHALMSVASGALTIVHLILLSIALRDSQRAEYLADERATGAAGSAGVRDLLDRLVTLAPVATVVARAARASGEVADWRGAADESHQRLAVDLPLRHQLSASDQASLFASHPPAGLRRRMADTKPWRDATVVLTEQQSAQIDAELADCYARARRDIGAIG